MSGHEWFLLISTVLGGLTLFLLGMKLMTEGLQKAAGNHLRIIVGRVARGRITGAGVGTVMGFLMHSSGATVMLVAFVNAGLLTLMGAVPAVLGANVGTTLSIQMISFDLGAYCYFIVALGFLCQMVAPRETWRQVGSAVLGLGLIFLGMELMKEAIEPYREVFQPFLARSNAATLGGMLYGMVIATVVTGIIQSSGATIGMCFALTQAGVFSSLAEVYPLVLGAEMGTCATALLASIGANGEARRVAVSHLMFNVLSVVAAMLLARPIIALTARSSGDLVHQIANLHTFIKVLGFALILPVTRQFVALVCRVAPSREAAPQSSFLDEKLLHQPEAAIQAALRELRRMSMILAESYRALADLILLRGDGRTIRRIRLNERILDEIKVQMREYLAQLTTRYLSRRQAVLVQHLDRCVVELERIGDHVESLSDLSLQRRDRREAIFGPEVFDRLFSLYKSAGVVLKRVIESLDADAESIRPRAQSIIEARDAYGELSRQAKHDFLSHIENKSETPVGGMFYSRYVASLDRIVRHAKNIALAEQQPTFWIKRKKLGRQAREPLAHEVPTLVDPSEYLDQLGMDDYL